MRQLFEKAKCVVYPNGDVVNPKAEKDCPTCEGHGVLLSVRQHSKAKKTDIMSFMRCPVCWTGKPYENFSLR